MGRKGYVLKDNKIVGGSRGSREKDVNGVVDFIRDFCTSRGYSPTVREITDGMNLSSLSVTAYYLNTLRKYGLVDWEDGKMRTIRVIEKQVA